MNIITVINTKGGCGKSTIAMNLSAGLARLGYRTLLVDMDPQAQVTQWLNRGDGLTSERTLVEVMAGTQSLGSVIQSTDIANLSFVASAIELEHLGRQIVAAQVEDQLEDVSVTLHRLRALEGHDEQVSREDGVLHDRADLVRAVEDDEVELLGDRAECTGEEEAVPSTTWTTWSPQ